MTKLEPIVVTGDLIHLTSEERTRYYLQVCESMRLNYKTRPLQYFEQVDRNGKRNLILYALRNASAQLRQLHNLSVTLSPAEYQHNAVIFTATVTSPAGSSDSAVGAESLEGLNGKEYADRIMAAQTKAKRRAILDFVGSGMLDESEIEGMHGSVVALDESTLEGYTPPPPAPVPSSEPATEVIPEKPAIDPAIIKAGDTLVAKMVESMKPLFETAPPFGVQGPATEPGITEKEVTSRMNTFKRDVLQTGGMRPSKGMGINAKWMRFVAKHAPNKTLDEYATLLIALDLCLEQLGPAGVVDKIEKEIAA
jgi:hypothetical protein